MNIIETSTPSGHTLFCDDIRQEANGKLIFIGVYSGIMYLGTPFPTHLKFALRIIYQERPGESSEPVEMKIFAPIDAEDEKEIMSWTLPANFRNVEMPPPAPGATTFVTNVSLIQFQTELAREGRIKVRAFRGDNEIRLGSLIVQRAPLQIVPDESRTPDQPT